MILSAAAMSTLSGVSRSGSLFREIWRNPGFVMASEITLGALQRKPVMLGVKVETYLANAENSLPRHADRDRLNRAFAL